MSSHRQDVFVDHTDPAVLVDVITLTAEELERRGERMLKLSRDLMAQAALHATLAELPEERTLSRSGQVVTEKEAILAVTRLKAFTRAQFAAELGLQTASVSRWLTKLINREHPIIERCDDGSYTYIDPNPVTELLPERRPATRRDNARKIGQRLGSGGVEGSSTMIHRLAKELQPIVREALREGWKLEDSGGHFKLTRRGERISISNTPRNAGNEAVTLTQRMRSPTRAHRQQRRSDR
jgi:hypothetical protein